MRSARVVVHVAVLALALSAHAAPRDVVAAYRASTPATIEARPASKPDVAAYTRIDVSDAARSTSFGHTTTLLVAPDGATYYVEYGRSTNRPARIFGPFSVAK